MSRFERRVRTPAGGYCLESKKKIRSVPVTAEVLPKIRVDDFFLIFLRHVQLLAFRLVRFVGRLLDN